MSLLPFCARGSWDPELVSSWLKIKISQRKDYECVSEYECKKSS